MDDTGIGEEKKMDGVDEETTIVGDKDEDVELMRVAMRGSLSSLLQLAEDFKTMTDGDVMERYIRLCPFVSPDSPAMASCLDALGPHRSPAEAIDATTCRKDRRDTHYREDVVDRRSSPPPLDGDDPDLSMDSAETSLLDTPQGGEPEGIIGNGEHAAPTAASSEAVLSPEEAPAAKVPKQESKKKRILRPVAGYAVRFLLLDVPLMTVLGGYLSLQWVHRVHDLYLKPVLDAVRWDDARAEKEITYYTRPCDKNDVTTRDGADLFLPSDATEEEAYEHQLLHGFTVFEGVLGLETARDLREHVEARNRRLKPEESLFVIEGDNRYSFRLGTEEPSVRRAVSEVANHDKLRPVLEKILGPNPAVIEMTAITSSHGAVDQYYHDDVVSTASAIKYARTFGPNYSVFIQLQNTTEEMGATSACPGTHYCSAGPIDQMCEEEGFQLVGDSGQWTVGDALLMNMNSLHRGSAHIDSNAPDRVMFILTFAPRPVPRAESRQMSQGITFSLRWDMWGHTLNDLTDPANAMRQPWATLRSLGLYKPSSADWGVDYVSGTLMRIANDENAFEEEDFKEWMDHDGFWWFPNFLHGQVGEGECWYEFYVKTMLRCETFLRDSTLYALGGYVALFFAIAMTLRPPESRFRSLAGALLRLTIMVSLLLLLLVAANRHVDSTGWAKDIRANRLYASVFENDEAFGIKETGPSTFPTRHDVLIENRYGSTFLEMYNDFVNGHPGNRVFRSALRENSKTYLGHSELFRDAMARYIVGAVDAGQGRFLRQGPTAGWHLLDEDAAVDYARKELEKSSNGYTRVFMQTIRFKSSEYRFGVQRDTSLARKHAVPYLQNLERRLWETLLPPRETSGGSGGGVSAVRWPEALIKSSTKASKWASSSMFEVPAFRSHPRHAPRSANLHPGEASKEPDEGAWIKAGDQVEGEFDNYWYVGTVRSVSSYQRYTIDFPDGDTITVAENGIRPFLPYREGERIEVLVEGSYHPCEIVARMEDGTYHAVLIENGGYLEDLPATRFSRGGGPKPKRVNYNGVY